MDSYEWPPELPKATEPRQPLFDDSGEGMARQLNRVLTYLEAHSRDNPTRRAAIDAAYKQVHREWLKVKFQAHGPRAIVTGVQ